MVEKRRVVVLAGETYSTNLGDGVIAQSLVYLFRKAAPDVEVRLLDISGRSSWGSAQERSVPDRIFDPIQKVSASLSYGSSATIVNILKWHMRRRRKYTRRWVPILADSSDLVVGGGQLLMDNSLDFPLKVRHIVRLARSMGLRIHFCACGVRGEWSATASGCFREALSNLTTITLRDRTSAKGLEELVPGAHGLATFDPAIWAAEVYGRAKKSSVDTVGLGVVGPRAVKSHWRKYRFFSRKDLRRFYVALIDHLYRGERRFEVFTNGSERDFKFAEEVAGSVKDILGIPCSLAERPMTPCALAQGISQYSALLASRLHASVIATSYRVPSIGFAWDEKVKHFYSDTERSDFCFDILDCDPSEVLKALLAAVRKGIPEASLERWKSRALENARIVLSSSC